MKTEDTRGKVTWRKFWVKEYHCTVGKFLNDDDDDDDGGGGCDL